MLTPETLLGCIETEAKEDLARGRIESGADNSEEELSIDFPLELVIKPNGDLVWEEGDSREIYIEFEMDEKISSFQYDQLGELIIE